jgi:DNA polymerase III subunit gamma/tau
MSWYLKYRPRQISDLDLADVRQTLLKMMETGTFPQALLFAGPKGTGKTSASRIIGAMLNDPANEEAVDAIFFHQTNKNKKKQSVSLKEPNPDSDFAQRVFRGQSFVVQEMDAASHRGIDDVRQLRERISLPPQEGKMAVYILDEVHMLTNEAFNALLKILEEPPPHVVFILATTELHKVPPTIVSRCNVVSFHKAGLDELVGRLEKILEQEKVEYESEALTEIARRADGSFRDAVKLAEIASQSGSITLDQIDALIGGSALVEVKKLVELVLNKDEQGLVQLFQELRQQNFNQDYFYQALYDYLHQNLLGAIKAIDYEPQLDKKVAQFLLQQIMLVDLDQKTPIPFLPLELKLLLIVQKAQQKVPGGGQEKKPALSSKNKSSTQAKHKQSKSQEVKADQSAHSELKLEQDSLQKSGSASMPETAGDDQNTLSERLCNNWEEFINMVDSYNSTLAALLRSSKPKSGPNGTATLSVYYRFHLEQLQTPKYKAIINKCGSRIVGDKIGFNIVLDNPPTKAELVEVPARTKELEALAEETLM